MKKKKLKKHIRHLQGELVSARMASARIRSQLNEVTDDRNQWRSKCESMYHTPEFKADTEAAFQRGVGFSKSQFKAWLIGLIEEIETQKVEDE